MVRGRIQAAFYCLEFFVYLAPLHHGETRRVPKPAIADPEAARYVGEIRGLRVGHQWRIRRAEIDRYLLAQELLQNPSEAAS
jgi:hypothetical protein